MVDFPGRCRPYPIPPLRFYGFATHPLWSNWGNYVATVPLARSSGAKPLQRPRRAWPGLVLFTWLPASPARVGRGPDLGLHRWGISKIPRMPGGSVDLSWLPCG